MISKGSPGGTTIGAAYGGRGQKARSDPGDPIMITAEASYSLARFAREDSGSRDHRPPAGEHDQVSNDPECLDDGAVENLSADIPALYVHHGARSRSSARRCVIGSGSRRRYTPSSSVCPMTSRGCGTKCGLLSLIGFQFVAQSEGLAFSEGDVVKQTGQYLWWRDTWQLKRIHAL